MAYLYDLTDTWNAAGTVFTAIKMNVTNSASAAGSKLVNLQVGATDKFSIDKDGNGYFAGTATASGSLTSSNLLLGGNSGTIGMSDNSASILAYNGTGSGGITNTLRFITGASERMRIDSSGNVGIGTTPSYKLDVYATGNISGRVKTSGSLNAFYMEDAGTTAGSLYIGSVGNDWRVVTGSNENLRITSGGNVGIGTSSPASKLNVSGGNVTVSAGYGIAFSGDQTRIMTPEDNIAGALINWASAGICRFVSGTTERARIDSSGNVGIGTSAPSNQLSVGGNNTATISLDWTGDNAAKAWFSANHSTGEVRHAAVTNYFPTFYSNNSERMRIDLSGNVGIGTSSITAKLDVFGDFVARTNASGGNSPLNVKNDSTANNTTKTTGLLFQGADTVGTGKNVGLVQCGPSDANWVTSYLAFQTRSGDVLSERVRIDSSGNLLVGTSTALGKLGVYGTTGFNADGNVAISGSGSHKFRGTAGGTTITTYDYLNYTAMQFIRDNGNPTNTVGSITCTDGSTSYNTSSDRRLKKDIAPAGDAGAVIDAIEIVSHGWKASEGTVPFGVIAQDLHAVAPQAVHAGDDGEEVEDVWGVDYSKLVPMLIKEIQSLRARVAQLEGN